MKKYAFLIPLTPPSLLTTTRQQLRTLCLETLVKQTYKQWTAILVGKTTDADPVNKQFEVLDFEGGKEEKLQKATEYIKAKEKKFDYIIRLDDDDIFNPNLLSDLADTDFDIYVDRYQTFWNPGSDQIAQKILYWFPNTCIHKYEHAMKQFGEFPQGDYKRFKSSPLLIENEHNDFHKYYIDKRIVYAKKNNPVYIRSLSAASITSLQSDDYQKYLSEHGRWRTNKIKSFVFLNKTAVTGHLKIKQGLSENIMHELNNLKALRNYKKIISGHA